MNTNATSSGTESKWIKTGQETLPDSPGVIVFPPVLFLSAVVLGVTLQLFWPIQVSRALPVKIIGGLFVSMGVASIVSAKKRMRCVGTNVRPDKPTTAIVTDGPYHLTRNPIYLGAMTAYLGLSLVFNAFWPLPVLIPFLFLLDWGVVRREEHYLEGKFGDVYLAYKARVRRWL
jgi:protein-S-isoprenylcysteine O-methyltransferase Ste14